MNHMTAYQEKERDKWCPICDTKLHREEALCYEFALQDIAFERQIFVDVIYKGYVIHGQRLDILVEHEVIVELKSVQKLPEVALAQVLSYLKATSLKRALLINFGEKKLINGVKRISL